MESFNTIDSVLKTDAFINFLILMITTILNKSITAKSLHYGWG